MDVIPTNIPMAAAFEFTLRAKAAAELSCAIYLAVYEKKEKGKKMSDSLEELLPARSARRRWTHLISLNCKVEAPVFGNVVKTVASES